MTDLAFDLAGAAEAEGAVQAFEDAVHLLNDTGDLADFLGQLRANNYWATLINALIIDKLNDCLIGVQLLLNGTSGQAAIAVAHWMEKNLRT